MIEVDEVSVSFGGVTALVDVSLQLMCHKVTGLIGPNGAGKSTLVNVLSGFQAASGGRVNFESEQLDTSSPQKVRAMGLSRTFQSCRLFANLTVRENIAVVGIGLGYSNARAFAVADEVINRFGLERCAEDDAGTVPYTDERRVDLARAMVGNPRYVLMDEPAAGMSDAECEEFVDILKQIPDTYDCGVMLIEHNMEIISRVCSDVYVLSEGKIIAHDAPAGIMRNSEVTRAYLG